MQVLIVEDDVIASQLLAGMLTQTGFEVSQAADGREALEMMEQTVFPLVICDWEMPQMSGLELCRRIRQRQSRQYVFILMLTSRRGTENIIAGLDAGADEFLSKPFEPEELAVRLRGARRILSLESREMIIFSLAKLAESRDPETGMHLERMREYSRLLASRLHLNGKHPEIDEDFVELIYLTSPLHDIGKVGIPDGVLLKPGTLSATEFRIMKHHARLGADTLHALVTEHPDAEYLRMARDIAWTHHEKFDGSGYPRGLSGTDIPLCGRIVALADVYDALTSKRVYKPAYTHEVAMSILVEGSGGHFDPEIVDVFVELESEFREIRCSMNKDDEFEVAEFNPHSLVTQ